MNISLLAKNPAPTVFSDKSFQVGKAQWSCIAELMKRYNRRKIPGTDNFFEDPIWRDTNSEISIIWSSVFEGDESTALILLLKIGTFYQLESKQIKISTLNGYLNQFKSSLGNLIKNKMILVGRENDLLIGVNVITADDIKQVLDNRIVSGLLIDKSVGPLNLIKQIPNQSVNNLSFFITEFEYPWGNGKYDSWVNSRYFELSKSIPEAKPFLSLPSSTTSKIIDRSMTMIEHYSEKVIAIHAKAKTQNHSNYGAFFNENYNDEFIEKIIEDFKELFPVILTDHRIKKISTRWFCKVVRLLIGACINIILLTTGLRNFDLVSLRVGCCKSSGRVDILNYIIADISKTSNRICIPVPNQTKNAIDILERLTLKDTDKYLIQRSRPHSFKSSSKSMDGSRVKTATINNWLILFANHFNIPFVNSERNNDEYTAHCYRATVAGWLDSASNLSILLIKRLFGHSNSLMPLAYIHHNPIFISARREGLELASEEMSKRMAKAAQHNLLSGLRGGELARGFEKQKNEYCSSSESLSDKELFTNFQSRIKERILNGSMYAMMTPFGVICTRNPNDSSPTPCAKNSDREMLKQYEIDKELWSYMQSRPNPGQCIGKRCQHAMLGPWSTVLKDSFIWYVNFLEGNVGKELSSNELIEEAKCFVKQYAPEMQKIFGLSI